jgi:FtsH-binding integral membrane protein
MQNIYQTKSEVVSRYVMKSYTLMFLTLLATTILASIVTMGLKSSTIVQSIIFNPFVLFGLIFGQIGLSFAISKVIPMKNENNYFSTLQKKEINYSMTYLLLGAFVVIESIFFALIVGSYSSELVISALGTTVILYGSTAFAGYRFKLMKNVNSGYLAAAGFSILAMAIINMLFFRANPLISMLISVGIIVISTIYNMANHATIEDEAELIMQGAVPEKSMIIIKAFQFYNAFLSMFYSILRILSFFSGND